MNTQKKEINTLEDFSTLTNDLVNELQKHLTIISSSEYYKKQSQYGVKDLVDKVETKIFQLKNQKFKILVIGEFKKGKSTFINSLLGAEILPAYSRPCTDVVNEISWGENERIVIQKMDSTTFEIKREDFEKHVTIGGELNSDNNKTKAAQVFYPINYCLNGVSIVDTPGLNEDIKRNNTTIGFLPSADAIVFMLSADQPCSMTELLMIEELVKIHGFKYIFFVCNRINVIRAKEVEDIKKYVTDKIRPYLMDGQNVYFIDALSALESKTENKPISKEFEQLENNLNEHLINNRALVRARNIIHELQNNYETTIERVIMHSKHLSKDLKNLNEQIIEQESIKTENDKLREEISNYWLSRKGKILDQFVEVIRVQFESGSIERDLKINIQKVCAAGGKNNFNDNQYCISFLEAILSGWLKRNLEIQINNSFNVILENEFSKISNMTFKHISKYLEVEEANLIKDDLSSNIFFNLTSFVEESNFTVLLETNKNERLRNRNMLIGSLLFSAIDLAFTGGGVSLLLTSLTGLGAGALFSKDANDHSDFINQATGTFMMQLSLIKNELLSKVAESADLIISEVDNKITSQIGSQLDSLVNLIEQRQMEYQLNFEEREKLREEANKFINILEKQKSYLESFDI